jgi:hypothetical protein
MDMNYIDRIASEIRVQVPAHELPDADTDSLFRIYAVLLLAKWEEVSSEDVHNAWVAWMSGKNSAHESLRPFEELSESVAADDGPFVDAIRFVAEERHADRR